MPILFLCSLIIFQSNIIYGDKQSHIVPYVYWPAPQTLYAIPTKLRTQSRQFSKELLAQPVVDVNDTIKQPAYFIGTTNFNMRKPRLCNPFTTAQNGCEDKLQNIYHTGYKVSAHYVTCKRDGTVHHMLNDYMRAWHTINS